MYREIDFRAINARYYNVKSGGLIEWRYGFYAFMRMPGGIDNGVAGNHRIFNDNGSYIIDPDTICQFTGLKDKNNLKIYESDIISDGVNNYEVKWIWNGFKILKGQHYVDFVEGHKNMEVIGNVFDNPDLVYY